MIKMKRYELKTGKFGYYFYDSMIQIDMSLEMVLNRLNYGNEQFDKYLESTNEQLNIINKLKRKIILLNEVKPK